MTWQRPKSRAVPKEKKMGEGEDRKSFFSRKNNIRVACKFAAITNGYGECKTRRDRFTEIDRIFAVPRHAPRRGLSGI